MRPPLSCAAPLRLFLLAAAICRALSELDVPGYPTCRAGTGGDLASTFSPAFTVTVDTSTQHQTVRGLGASDCWSIQYVGLYPDATRNAIADLLFDSGLDANNNPRGIALNQWRFNLGAGSSRQTSSINDPWRRADSFFDDTLTLGAYDWTRLPGQRWFLQAAKDRGVNHFTAFVNSPPTHMTKNGYAYADSGTTTNLASDKIDDFATYLADVLGYFRDTVGIPFDVLSPINEPQWDWDGSSGQEGCPYSSGDIKSVVDVLAEKDLGGTKVEIMESGEINDLFTAQDYVDNFWDTGSTTYVGTKVDNTVAGHSYWSDELRSWPWDKDLIDQRVDLKTKLEQYGLGYAMTEYCILDGDGPGRDFGITPALRVARTLHFDLTLTDAISWSWWLAVSPYDYKDGLVYIDKDEEDSPIYTSKIHWAVGNYARFISGMTRVGTIRSDNASQRDTATTQMASAYFDSVRNIVVIVTVNMASQEETVQFKVPPTIDTVIPYVTSATGDLTAYASVAPVSADASYSTFSIAIPQESIVTLVGYTASSASPSKAPSKAPSKPATTAEPTRSPTHSPSESPTKSPSESPTENPTTSPTKTPTVSPTKNPTEAPESLPGQCSDNSGPCSINSDCVCSSGPTRQLIKGDEGSVEPRNHRVLKGKPTPPPATNSPTKSPVPPTSEPTKSPTPFECKCILTTQEPTSAPTPGCSGRNAKCSDKADCCSENCKNNGKCG